MKAFIAQVVVTLAVVSGFAVSAQAQQVTPETAPATITISTTVTAVGVLAKDDKVNQPVPV